MSEASQRDESETLQVETFVFVVPTRSLAESIRFYREGLGLRLVDEWTELGTGALLEAASGAQVELLELDGVADAPEPRVGLGLEVRGVDAAYDRLLRIGARVKAPPRARPWGMYGFGTLDPNGVPVNVYEPTPAGVGEP